MTLAGLLAGIEAALAVTHSAALDLAPAGRVARGRYSLPPQMPFCAVSGPDVRSEQGPVLGEYTRTVVVDVQCWVPVSMATLDARVRAAEIALDLLVDALDAARDSSASALFRPRTWVVSGGIADADGDPQPADGTLILLQLELTYATRNGLTR